MLNKVKSAVAKSVLRGEGGKIFRVFIIILAGLSLASLSTDAAFTSQATVSGNQFSTGTWEKPKAARIVVNEVYYEGTHEWIELYNGGEAVADIKGWQICDHLSTEHCGSLNPEQKNRDCPGRIRCCSPRCG